MKILIEISKIFCQALRASHLTRMGRWQQAVKIMEK